MESVSGVGVIDKAVTVLNALARSGAVSLNDLQAATGLPRATVHRLAVALEAHGLVQRDHSGRFILGRALVPLGQAASSSMPLADLARPVLERLQSATGESVQLYVREGEGRRCLVSLESLHGLRWIVPEGSLLPLDAGSAGHVLSGSRLDRRGWLQSVGEREAGVASVSAPVLDSTQHVIAAVSVSGPIERLTKRPGDLHGDAVVSAARELAALL